MAGEWTVKRFEQVVPAELTADEHRLVGMWRTSLEVNPAVGATLLPSDHIGTTYPPEHEDYEPGFENTWHARIPGTDWGCTFEVNYADREVVLWMFDRLPPPH